MRLSHLAGAYAGTLSGGQRKLLELGRALMVEPRMILPRRADGRRGARSGEQLLDHIRELREHRGVTVLVIEHDMDVVMSISDRVIVMDEGHVIAEGRPRRSSATSASIEAYLGRLGGIRRQGPRRDAISCSPPRDISAGYGEEDILHERVDRRCRAAQSSR